ncbi:hypothetical protein G6F35_017352 [Rhizopus arrhizus]|nr:hypothetical protein G6F35_017352 [Rhizopus arrhizus]
MRADQLGPSTQCTPSPMRNGKRAHARGSPNAAALSGTLPVSNGTSGTGLPSRSVSAAPSAAAEDAGGAASGAAFSPAVGGGCAPACSPEGARLHAASSTSAAPPSQIFDRFRIASTSAPLKRRAYPKAVTGPTVPS